MRIDILTLFPEMFAGPFGHSIVSRAQSRSLVELNLYQIRDYAYDRHRQVDDYPYGGGPGMILKPDPLLLALDSIPRDQRYVILTTPQGEVFTQRLARAFSQLPHLVILCGHYEGIDERVKSIAVQREISIGDYVLTGGELPAMVVCDAVIRLLPGALGADTGADNETFEDGLLEHPQYTRPVEYRGAVVPPALLSGHHAQIHKWRRKESFRRTLQRRPELLAKAPLQKGDLILLKELMDEGL